MRGREHDLNVRGAFLHMVADALVSLGVVVAGALYLWQGWAWMDPVISLAIAVVIVVGTWGLLRQSLHLLFDGVPEHIDLAQVHAWLAARPGVSRVDDLHVWALSTTQVALTAHLVMPHGQPGDEFLRDTAQGLQHEFGIAHPTLQISREPWAQLCHELGAHPH
jgi:cobalt-zinc-cadmium efflux system protein